MVHGASPQIVMIVSSLISALIAGQVRADDMLPTEAVMKSAIAKSLPLLEKGAKGSLEKRKQCFNCHNQGLPVMALKAAQSRGFEIDAEHVQQQLKFTADFLGRNRDRYLQGEGQGGQIDTAGYALWTLDLGGWKPDLTTSAVAEYFLQYQSDLEHWKPNSDRPPSEQSRFTSTFLATRGLKAFSTNDQVERVDKRLERIRDWALKTEPADTEDRVFRMRLMQLVNAESGIQEKTLDQLLGLQREDGGWGQTNEMSSDAYATGTALTAILEGGRLPASDSRVRKALSYLISIQQEDGSWHVVSHSKPFQTYFESGYPHGKDQFISIAAASWSTTALALALPPSAGLPNDSLSGAAEKTK